MRTRAWPAEGVGRGVEGLMKREEAGPEPFLMSVGGVRGLEGRGIMGMGTHRRLS